jgi:RecJ-like exonuclease
MAQVQTCGICDGKGYFRCPICHGKGVARKEVHTLSENVFRAEEEVGQCHSCEGTGKLLCKICGGSGKILIEKPSSTGFKNLS